MKIQRTPTERAERRKLRRERRLKRRAKEEEIAASTPVKVTAHLNGKVVQPYVATDAQNHTSIVLHRTPTRVYHIPMVGAGLRIEKTKLYSFDHEYHSYEYDVQKAAQSYLNWSDAYLGLTEAARRALSSIIQGEVDMSDVQATAENQGEATKVKAKANGNGKAKLAAKATKPSKAVVTKVVPAKPAKAAKGKAKAAPKKGKAKAAPKEKKAKKAGGSGRPSSLDGSLKIKKLVPDNPRREGSNRYKRFAKYKDGITVAKLLDSGVSSKGIHTDVDQGYIKLVK
jgi:hypothetical protein